MTEIERIDQLREELHRHNYNYYVLNAPEITDQEFDKLMRELQDLEEKHPEHRDENSPSMRVGSDINKNFTQVVHKYPMLSLANTYSETEVTEFYDRVKKSLNEDFEICCEMKYDGTSISLTYENGKLVRAVTRGDGVQGDDVTGNVKTIRSIPLVLHGKGYPETFEIRGEILMPWVVFEELNKEREAREEPLFANPRNAASGTLKAEREYDEIIFTSPDGEQFNQPMANSLSLAKNLIILCGHFKGIDYRIREHFITKEISIGDYVLTGGELAAAVIADAVVRIIPGVISDEQSALSDSFQDNLLAAPVYTRPAEYKGWQVPDVLLSGHEAKIKEWELQQSLERTQRLRPDLLK
jgi:tRNA (guanine-N1)-methyltransferase